MGGMLCMKLPSDPTGDPNNVTIELITNGKKPTIENGVPLSIRLCMYLPQHVETVHFYTSCEDFDSMVTNNSTEKYDTLTLAPMFTTEGLCTLFVSATLSDDKLKDKTDFIVFQVLPAKPTLMLVPATTGLFTRIGSEDTLAFSVGTTGISNPEILFSFSATPSVDSSFIRFAVSEKQDSLLVIVTPLIADSINVIITASLPEESSDTLMDSAEIAIRVFKAFSFNCNFSPDTLQPGTDATFIFTASKNRPDMLKLHLAGTTNPDLKTDTLLSSDSDSLTVHFTPENEIQFDLLIEVSNGIITDTIPYQVSVHASKTIRAVDSTGPEIIYQSGPITDSRVLSAVDTLEFTVTDSSGIDSVWWTLDGSTSVPLLLQQDGRCRLDYHFTSFGMHTVALFARDNAIRKNIDSVSILLNYNTRPDKLTLAGPAHESSGIDTLPLFSWSGGNDEDGDTVYYKVIYGLVETELDLSTSIGTEKTATVTERLSPFTEYFWQVIAWTTTFPDTVRSATGSFTTLDPTAADEKGPTIAQLSGPVNGTRVTTATGTITFTVSDPGGVDSVLFSINNGPDSLLSADNNTYSIDNTLTDFGTNYIIIRANDKSANHNRDSLTITFIYNTVITAVNAIAPVNNAEGIPLLPVFYWNGGNDADGDSVFFHIEYGKTENNLNMITTVVTDTNVAIASGDELEAYTEYYWQVVAFSKIYPDTARSNIRSFTTIGTAPEITRSPVSDTINEGAPFTLSVTATGTPAPGYQWYKDGNPLPNETGTSLIILAAEGADSGDYYVHVSNGVGDTMQSQTARITVRLKPRITIQPSNQTITEDAIATFAVSADGTEPFSYQWQENQSNITGQTSDTCSLAAAADKNGYRYRCIITNTAGTVTSNEAVLTVSLIAPSITSDPRDTTVFLGSGSTMTVGATGTDISYQWLKDGSAIVGETEASFSIATTKLSDNGVYRCRVSNSGGDKYSQEAILEVKPKGMRLIAGGEFDMGEEIPAASIYDSVHHVTITDSYWMDTTEVTQKQYDSLMSLTYQNYTIPSWRAEVGLGDDYPAYSINWFDAVLFCNAKTKSIDSNDTVYSYISITGSPGNDCELQDLLIDFNKIGFRLPTEAEWEYACRAGTATSYFWEENYYPYPEDLLDSNQIDMYAIWKRNSSDLGFGNSGYGSHIVANRLPNAFGLYDMSGNLWEWVNDWFDVFGRSPMDNPKGPATGYSRVLKSGHWQNPAETIRSANRSFGGPDGFQEGVGFRVCLPD